MRNAELTCSPRTQTPRSAGRLARALVLGLAALTLANCASRSTVEQGAIYDPFEGPNRFIFNVNMGLDTFVLRPAATAYGDLLPQPVRTSVRSFLRNLRSPVILINDLLQGKWDRAENTASRLLINTTLGVGGLFDVAEDFGHPYHSEDFGQTLAVWMNTEDGGPYLVLPILGPSNVRDTVGFAGDVLMNPTTWIGGSDWETANIALRATGAVDARSEVRESFDSLLESSPDFYATIRSLYYQRRNAEIRDGAPDINIPAPDFSYDDTAQ